MATQYTITAESTPVYDKWGWDDHWSLKDWVTWHKKLVAKYSNQNKTTKDKLGNEYEYNKVADSFWLNAWNEQSFGAEPKNSLGNFMSDEVKYIKKHLLLFVGTGGVLLNTLTTNPTIAIQTAQEVGEGVVNTAVGIYKGMKVLLVGGIIVVAGLATVVAVSLFNKYSKTLKS